jgi:hypothetical protein
MQVNYGTRQKLVVVFFKGVKIGEYRLDMVAEDQIILEFKAVPNSIASSRPRSSPILKLPD